MKIIAIDNFGRDYVSDKLIAENVSELYAKEIAEYLNKTHGGEQAWYYFEAVPDDHKLYEFQL